MRREETGRARRSIAGSSLASLAELFWFESVYMTPGLLVTDGVRLSQSGKRIFSQELEGLSERALDYI